MGAKDLVPTTFGDDLPGFVCGTVGAPGVVVVQEWWGVTEIVKEQAAKLAAKGEFRCLIPDLYKGKIGVDAEEASHLMGALDFNAAVKELAAAVAFLKAEGSPQVGLTGFCMGGALTLAAASRGVEVKCIQPFYGIPSKEHFDVTAISVPVLAHFGQLDKNQGFSDPATAQATVDAMKAAGVDVELKLYPTAGHGFLNSGTDGGDAKLQSVNFPIPSPDDVEAAWTNLLAFFKKHLC